MTSVGGIGSVCSGTVVDSALYGRIRRPPLNGRILPSSSMTGCHVDTVDRAGRETAFAAGALCLDDRMHELRKSQDSIDRACTAAQVAADTQRLVDRSNSVEARMAERFWNRQRFLAEHLGELSYGRKSAGWAEVDRGRAVDECLRVRPATGVAALPALNSWQHALDSIDGCITLICEQTVAKQQQCGECDRDQRQDERARHRQSLAKPLKP